MLSIYKEIVLFIAGLAMVSFSLTMLGQIWKKIKVIRQYASIKEAYKSIAVVTAKIYVNGF